MAAAAPSGKDGEADLSVCAVAASLVWASDVGTRDGRGGGMGLDLPNAFGSPLSLSGLIGGGGGRLGLGEVAASVGLTLLATCVGAAVGVAVLSFGVGNVVEG